MQEKMKKTLCRISQPMQTKFSYIRSHESPLGSFFADLIRKELSADCAILNSGGIRSDRYYEPGYLTIGDWTDIFPYRKTLMKAEVTGSQLLKIIEEGISKYPALEGRFPQVSNIYYEFDADRPPFERLLAETVKIKGEPINPQIRYVVASTGFIIQGYDGYETFKEATPLMGDDEAPIFLDTLFQVLTYPEKDIYFNEIQVYRER